ncbi:MAG TPA: type II toxin-antitoxin system PemK/MazF family toxin [Vicinamibacterales bacterium]|nr:type II toxin-antitoxin system PemK/MazF family toxin [Vicinamibacterales bacterium]
MKRGELYRLRKPGGGDPKLSRVFAVASRQSVIDSRFATVICVPVYSARHGLATQVALAIDEGLKHDSALHCDELVSVPKSRLTDFVGALSSAKLRELDRALVAALDIDVETLFA